MKCAQPVKMWIHIKYPMALTLLFHCFSLHNGKWQMAVIKRQKNETIQQKQKRFRIIYFVVVGEYWIGIDFVRISSKAFLITVDSEEGKLFMRTHCTKKKNRIKKWRKKTQRHSWTQTFIRLYMSSLFFSCCGTAFHFE